MKFEARIISEKSYDVIVVGAGPRGAAAVVAALANKEPREVKPEEIVKRIQQAIVNVPNILDKRECFCYN